MPVLPSVLTAGQSVIFFIPAKDDFGEFAPARLPARAQHSVRRHTFAGNNAFPRIVNSQMLAETRSIAQVAVAATCSAVTCGAAFRVRNSLIEPSALLCRLKHDGQATAAGVYALSVTANEGKGGARM